MKKKYFILQIVFVFSLGLSLKAQQFPYFTQYSFNKFLINPAAAGVDGYTTVNLIAREQWVGGSTPYTYAIAFDSKILENSYIMQKIPVRKKNKKRSRPGNIGWGVSLVTDKNGPISKTYLSGTYAYHLDLGKKQLSLGFSMQAFQNRIDGTELITYDQEINDYDPLLSGNKESFWILDANFGAFLKGKDYYAGYSTIQLLNSSAQFGVDGSAEYKLKRQHNLIGGYQFLLTDKLDLETSANLRIQEIAKAQLDLTTKLLINKDYWAGLNYKTGSALALFGGLKWDRYCFSYAFEYSFNSFAKATLATHELSIVARFGENARRYRWLQSY